MKPSETKAPVLCPGCKKPLSLLRMGDLRPGTVVVCPNCNASITLRGVDAGAVFDQLDALREKLKKR